MKTQLCWNNVEDNQNIQLQNHNTNTNIKKTNYLLDFFQFLT